VTVGGDLRVMRQPGNPTMVVGSVIAIALSAIGVPIVEQVLLSALMCLMSAWLGARLHQEEKHALAMANLTLD